MVEDGVRVLLPADKSSVPRLLPVLIPPILVQR